MKNAANIPFRLIEVPACKAILIVMLMLVLPLPSFAGGLDLNKIRWHDSSGQSVDVGDEQVGENKLEEAGTIETTLPIHVPLPLVDQCETEGIDYLDLVDVASRSVFIEVANEICAVYELASYELSVVDQLPLTRESVRARHKIGVILVDLASKHQRLQDEIQKFALHAIDERIESGNDLMLSMDNQIGSKLMRVESLLNYIELSINDLIDIRIERTIQR